jgi:hypothetical protein
MLVGGFGDSQTTMSTFDERGTAVADQRGVPGGSSLQPQIHGPLWVGIPDT